MKTRLIFAWFALYLLTSSLAWAEDFSGKCIAVINGDTIQVIHNGSPEKIRLDGIYAPEFEQAFGQQAKQALSALAFGKALTVKDHGKDKDGRTLATILDPSKNYDLNAMLVRNGFAWYYKKYSQNVKLAEYERLAKISKLGLWKDHNPMAPWEFRKLHLTQYLNSLTSPSQNKELIVYVPINGKTYHSLFCKYISPKRKAVYFSKLTSDYDPCCLCNPPSLPFKSNHSFQKTENPYSISESEKKDRESQLRMRDYLESPEYQAYLNTQLFSMPTLTLPFNPTFSINNYNTNIDRQTEMYFQDKDSNIIGTNNDHTSQNINDSNKIVNSFSTTNTFTGEHSGDNLFYDPKRPEPYSSNYASHQMTKKDSINALAEQFDKPTEWIESHMGNSNDLRNIHINLTRQILIEDEGF